MQTPPPAPPKERQGKQYNIPNPLENIGDTTKWGLRGCARFGSLGCLGLLFVLCCTISLVASPIFDGVAAINGAVDLLSYIVGRNLKDILPGLISFILDLAGTGGVGGAFFTFACLASPCLIVVFLVLGGTWLPNFINKKNVNGGHQIPLPPPPPKH